MQLIRDNFKWLDMQEKTFVWFQIQENIDKITIENIFKTKIAKLADKAG